MGATPLTWSEINSFVNCSGYKLSGWEAEQLIMMSRDYCGYLDKAKKFHCPPPYQEGISDEEAVEAMRERVARQWASFENGFKNKKVKKAL